MRVSEYHLQFDEEIERWDEGIPLGGGNLGCLVYGRDPLRIHLDRIDLWDERECPETKEQGFNYRNLVRLIRSGSDADYAEHNRLFDGIYNRPTPTKITAGGIELRFQDRSKVSYRLDLAAATASVVYPHAQIKLFCSAKDHVGVASVSGEAPEVRLSMPAYLTEGKLLDYPPPEFNGDGKFLYCIQRTKSNFRYGIFVFQRLKENGADIVFSLETSRGKIAPEQIRQKLSRLADTIGEIERRHRNDWKKFWCESEVRLPEPALEKQYYLGNYFFFSGSAHNPYPIPLQGLWTADDDDLPPWKGDYHHDLNTQFTYSHCLKANHLRGGRVFIDYIWLHRRDFSKFAREFYGVEGFLIPAVSSLHGKPLGGWPQYSFSPTMTIWCVKIFEEYFSLTQDLKFLRTRAFPIFSETEKAISAMLEEKDGKLHLPLSTSPEYFNNAPQSYLVPDSNNDLALLRYLYRTLAEFSEILNREDVYSPVLEKLDDYHGDECLWIDRETKPFASHRHHSHLMGIYPLKDPCFFHGEGSRRFEESLAQLEKLGVRDWVGFSFTWASVLYTMAGNGKKPFELLYDFCRALVSPNGFHLNGDFRKTGLTDFDYRPFTLESNMSFCDAVQNMLLYYADGIYHLFRGVDGANSGKEWAFDDFREYGGLLFSARCREGECSLVIQSPREQEIRVEIFGKRCSLSLKKGKTRFCLHTNGRA